MCDPVNWKEVAPRIYLMIEPGVKLYPNYGYTEWYREYTLILISDRFKKGTAAYEFIFDHEMHHAKQTADEYHKNVIWAEILANWYALKLHPFGFIKVLWMTLTDKTRRKLYVDMLKDTR